MTQDQATRPRLLIVDDDEAIRQVMTAALVDEGYAVESAANGLVALRVLERLRPDAIVLDMQMPVMGGLAFAAAYHARRGPHAPIIVCSSHHEHGTPSAVHHAAYVAKPFDLETLLDAVSNVLARRESVSPSAGRSSANGAPVRIPRRTMMTAALRG